MAKFALILFNYFPYGGLQRDFQRIAVELLDTGHQVDVLTMDWQGEQINGTKLYLFERSKGSAVTRNNRFFKAVKKHLASQHYDCIVGFNKMPFLDAYFAADTCYIHKALTERPVYYRLTRRFRHFYAAERAVFSNGENLILHISPMQAKIYESYYPPAKNNTRLLGPNVDKKRYANPLTGEFRVAMRAHYKIESEQKILLMVASSFKSKGVERAIKALASLSSAQLTNTQLWIAGDDKPGRYQSLVDSLGVSAQVKFLGARDDIAILMGVTDLLVHPAHVENTGTVIVEAIASGLPVLTTSNCGYAFYVNAAKAGQVVMAASKDNKINEEAFQNNFNKHLRKLLASDLTVLHDNAIAYSQVTNLSTQTRDAVQALTQYTAANADLLHFRHQSFEALQKHEGQVFRHKKNRLTKRISGKSQSFIIKLHARMGLTEYLATLLKGKRPVTDAFPEKQAIEALTELGIRVPKCFIYRSQGCGANKRSFVLLEDFGDVESLEDWIDNYQHNKYAYRRKTIEQTIKKVANIVKTLHENDWVHRDLYLCHFFVLENETDDNELALIDLHRCEKVSAGNRQNKLIKDLGALYFSSEETLSKMDCLRFIKHYSCENSLRAELTKYKDFWSKVEARKNQLRQRNKRG